MGTVPFGIRPPPSDLEVAGTSLETTVTTLVLLVLWLSITTFLVFTPHHIQQARKLLTNEQSRIAAEKNAYESFKTKLAALTPASTTPPTTPTANALGGGIQSHSQSTNQLQQVRAAYRDTVMAVDHYDDDYGETLAEHLTAEFGDDIATSVTTGATLSPQLHTTLLNQVDHAVHTRRILYTSLENEDARLSDAHTTLTSLNDTTTTVESTAHHTDDFETLRENWETIDSLQSQLDTLVKEHQTRRSNVPVRGDTKAFYAYLYEQLETTHPVLTDALTFDETLKTLDQNITHKLTTTA